MTGYAIHFCQILSGAFSHGQIAAKGSRLSREEIEAASVKIEAVVHMIEQRYLSDSPSPMDKHKAYKAMLQEALRLAEGGEL